MTDLDPVDDPIGWVTTFNKRLEAIEGNIELRDVHNMKTSEVVLLMHDEIKDLKFVAGVNLHYYLELQEKRVAALESQMKALPNTIYAYIDSFRDNEIADLNDKITSLDSHLSNEIKERMDLEGGFKGEITNTFISQFLDKMVHDKIGKLKKEVADLSDKIDVKQNRQEVAEEFEDLKQEFTDFRLSIKKEVADLKNDINAVNDTNWRAIKSNNNDINTVVEVLRELIQKCLIASHDRNGLLEQLAPSEGLPAGETPDPKQTKYCTDCKHVGPCKYAGNECTYPEIKMFEAKDTPDTKPRTRANFHDKFLNYWHTVACLMITHEQTLEKAGGKSVKTNKLHGVEKHPSKSLQRADPKPAFLECDDCKFDGREIDFPVFPCLECEGQENFQEKEPQPPKYDPLVKTTRCPSCYTEFFVDIQDAIEERVRGATRKVAADLNLWIDDIIKEGDQVSTVFVLDILNSLLRSVSPAERAEKLEGKEDG